MSKPEESRTAQAAEQVEEQSLLNQIVDQGHFSERQRGKDLIREFVTQFLEGSMTASRDTEAMINARIAQIDHLVSIQLNEVLHNAQFQKLEGSWRGLRPSPRVRMPSRAPQRRVPSGSVFGRTGKRRTGRAARASCGRCGPSIFPRENLAQASGIFSRRPPIAARQAPPFIPGAGVSRRGGVEEGVSVHWQKA